MTGAEITDLQQRVREKQKAKRKHTSVPKYAQTAPLEGAQAVRDEDFAARRLNRELAARPWSDFGNAERLVARHGQDLLYVGGRWFVFDGKRYRRDDTAEIERLAKATVRAMRREAAELDDAATARSFFNFALLSEKRERIAALIKLASSESQVVARPDDLDSNPMLLNARNGTVDLSTGELRRHDRADRITALAPVDLDPTATCPHWDAALKLWLPDPEVRRFQQKFIGYCMTGAVHEQCTEISHGEGCNGKSTFMETIRSMLGDYAAAVDASTFTTSYRRSVRSDLARLRGKRLVTANEIESDARLAEQLVKQVTGGEPIVASFLFKDEFEYRPQFKLIIGTNDLPIIRDDSHAMWRRLRVVYWPTKIEKPDKRLHAALRGELSGILNWALAGCADWLQNGLGYPPDAISEATHAYRASQDVFSGWIEDSCTTGDGLWTTAADLKASYTAWADQVGIGYRLDWVRGVTPRLAALPGVTAGKHKRVRCWWGIGLNGDAS